MSNESPEAGKTVDYNGKPSVDPTKNVRELFDAGMGRQDDLRAAETRRLNDLAALRVLYDKIISDNQAASTTSALSALATLIDRGLTALGERVSKLEQFRWESSGATGVSDPAILEALRDLNLRVRGISIGESKIEGKGIGQGQVIAWGITGAMFVIAAISTTVTILTYATK